MQKTVTLTLDELSDLVSAIETAADRMEPYYKQNGGDEDVLALATRYRDAYLPYYEVIPGKPMVCPECKCQKHEAHAFSMHLLNQHQWSSKRRRNFIASLAGGTRVWASKAEFLAQTCSVPV